MSLSHTQIAECLASNNITVNGVLHIGACDCEERAAYNTMGVEDNDIVWVEAQQTKVDASIAAGIPNVYQGVIAETTAAVAEFYLANDNNVAGLLPFGTHIKHYTDMYLTEKIELATHSLSDFIVAKNLVGKELTLWRLSTQGTELSALRGAVFAANSPLAIHTTVYTEEVFRGCSLLTDMDQFLASAGFTRELIEIGDKGSGEALYIKST